MQHAYVGFGANLGDPYATFAAVQASLTLRGYGMLRVSQLYETAPWGGVQGGMFLNAVLEFARHGSAADFQAALQAVETELGRVRERRGAARTCDLDLLLWGDECIEQPALMVPHPLLAERRFVLVPLCDLIGEAVHPLRGVTFRALLESTSDRLDVRPATGTLNPNLV